MNNNDLLTLREELNKLEFQGILLTRNGIDIIRQILEEIEDANFREDSLKNRIEELEDILDRIRELTN